MIAKVAAGFAVLVALAGGFGWFLKYDATVVKAEDIKPMQQSIQKLNTRLDRSDLEQQSRDLQRRIWLYQDRYGDDVMRIPEPQREEYRCLVRDKAAADARIGELKMVK